MTTNKQKKLGIIQTRGLGDIFIALPIAHYYYKQNWQILWPIADNWIEEMSNIAPWVRWIPITPDHGPFFYDIPYQRLKNFGCDEILPLYNALTNHPEFSQELHFNHTSFDRYKYIKAQVPFLHKWNLKDCITRFPDREQNLYNKLVTNPNYVVLHTKASEQTATFDTSIIPDDWQQIEITQQGWTTDWLTIIDNAQSIIMTDSVFANITDQLGLGSDRYFLPLHHIQLTPVHGHDWTWITNNTLNPRTRIFQPGK
jgi:hypothetical protein